MIVTLHSASGTYIRMIKSMIAGLPDAPHVNAVVRLLLPCTTSTAIANPTDAIP